MTDFQADDIAIIALTGRFPKAPTVEQLWQNLRAGVEGTTHFSDAELLAAGVDPALVRDPAYVKSGAVLDGVELFDAAFFGFNPREAEITDPQHRLFLECAWEVLELAGYDSNRYDGRIGVFAGMSNSTYFFSWYSNAVGIDLLTLMGNEKDHLATRVSYKLNLRGPSVTVQTACSTSLVAVHLACESLLSGACDMALAGGIRVHVPQNGGYMYYEGGLSSPDGTCRAFDASAQGTFFGSGAGVVVLKRLEQALADGDTIHAVIKGSAINNDGAGKVGYTAPSVEGQAEVIAEAQAIARVAPETISYIEAHGTGTLLGDPIELAALTRVFRTSTDTRGFCAIGSIKTNLGHLEAAAGVSGLIKTVLALRHQELPPSLHFTTPNPRIDWDNSPFYVNAHCAPWPTTGAPRRAAVSSFGIGGTNAHVILQEAPPSRVRPSAPGGRAGHVLVLSAKTPTALETATANLAAFLEQQPDVNLESLAYTLQVGRRAFAYRRTLVCQDRADALALLAAATPQRLWTATLPAAEPALVFLLPGQGAQYVGMAAGLYLHEPVFRKHVDHAERLLQPHLRELLAGLGARDLRQVLFQPGDASVDLTQTALAQPALFVIEYALAQLWLSWGLQPQAMLGHSVGEYVAATLAGVFSLDDALALVALRGRLMQSMPHGAMLAVPLAEHELRPLLPPEISLAAINGPSLCVVAGPDVAVTALEARLCQRDLDCRRLHTSHAFHSAMLDPIVAPFAAAVARVQLHPPQIPVVSNVSGQWLTAAEATDPHYWASQLRATVRFADGLQTATQGRPSVLLEVGPGHTLSTFARAATTDAELTVLSSLRHAQEAADDMLKLMSTLARLWLVGMPINWRALYGAAAPGRIPAPTYPFERQRYWINSVREHRSEADAPAATNSADGCYLPAWKRALPPVTCTPEPQRWLVLSDQHGVGDVLMARLSAAGHQVIRVVAGDQFAHHADTYTVDPSCAADYVALVQALCASRQLPDRIVHLWSLDDAPDLALASLLELTQALVSEPLPPSFQLHIVANKLVAITDQERATPRAAALLGLSQALTRAYPQVSCHCFDIGELPTAGHADPALDQLLIEWQTPVIERIVAYRGRQRWLPAFEPLQLPSAAPVRDQRVYLLAGMVGETALMLAQALVAQRGARLVLAVTMPLPERDQWSAVDASDARTRQVIERARRVEAQGGEVLLVAGTEPGVAQFEIMIEQVIARHGALHGVVYDAGLDDLAQIALEPKVIIERAQTIAAELTMLDQSLSGRSLDVALVCGSTPALVGELGVASAVAAQMLSAICTVPDAAQPWCLVHWDTPQLSPTPSAADADPGTTSGGFLLRLLERVLPLRSPDPLVISICSLADRVSRTAAIAALPSEEPPATALYARPQLAETYAAPRSVLEQQVVAIWQSVLGIQDVGIYDNFFELGGHSLLATQVIARIRTLAQVDLPLNSLFNAPTVAELCAQIETMYEHAAPRQAPPILPVARDRPLPLSFAQQRLLFLDQLTPDNPFYNIPGAVRISGALDVAALGWCLNEIVRRHEVLRTTFTFADDQPAQVISAALDDSLMPRLPLIDLRELPSTAQDLRVRELMIADAQQPFDLLQGPVIRTSLLQLADDEYLLLFAMHHIASDAWSFGILFQELSALYTAFVSGMPSPLPPLPVQYADVAVWQRGWLSGAVLDQQIGYWQRQLEGLPTLNLPTDRPRPAVQTFRGARQTSLLARPLVDELLALAQAAGATLFMVTLAGWVTLLHWYTSQDDIVVGTDVANRAQGEAEALIGFFVNQLVLRIDLQGDPTFREILARARQVALDAYVHQDLPFDKLVETLRPARDLSRTPLFQVKLVLHNTPMSEVTIPGLTLRALDVDNQTAKFDLLLNLSETAEGLQETLEYNTDLFQSETIILMLDRYTTLLQQVVTEPDLRLSELAARLSAQQREQQAREVEQRKASRQHKLRQVQRKEFRGVTNLDEETTR